MRMLAFSARNMKEILRDPLTAGFSLGFPLILLVMMSAIQKAAPVPVFEIQSLTPGMTVFGLSFMTLFSATLIAKDRETSFLTRLYTTPMTAADFIFGYLLPLLPLSLLQCIICYAAALVMGLGWTADIFSAVLFIIPLSIFFIALGLLFGSILTTKQTGGICGALLTILTAWFSGAWFDIHLIGGVFEKIAEALPYIHAVSLEKYVLAGQYSQILPDLVITVLYGAGAMVLAVVLFLKQMKNN